jgi:hypothetical protein
MLAQPAVIFDWDNAAKTAAIRPSRDSCMPRFPIPAVLVAIVAATLAGCAGDANPVRDVAIVSGLTGGEPKPAPDFVARTRPAELDYLPVGVSPPPRRYRAKDKGEVESAESQMNRISRANEARAAQARRAAGGP